MRAERTTTVAGHRVSEYWWAGKMVVYLDHGKTDESYEACVARVKKDAEREKPT